MSNGGSWYWRKLAKEREQQAMEKIAEQVAEAMAAQPSEAAAETTVEVAESKPAEVTAETTEVVADTTRENAASAEDELQTNEAEGAIRRRRRKSHEQ